jgi:hypothetical protein
MIPHSLDTPPTNRRTCWRRFQVTGWCGRFERLFEIVSGTPIWHHPGRLVPIRYMLVRDVADVLKPQAFLCTDLDADPLDTLRWFARRWSIEVTFAEVRRHRCGTPAPMVRPRHRAHHTHSARAVLTDHPLDP